MSFTDFRGSMFFPLKEYPDFVPVETTLTVNKKNVFRGFHSNPFDKIVTCVQGQILDIIVNLDVSSPNYLLPQYFMLDPNTPLFQVFVPKNHGHACLSLQDDSILLYHFNGHYSDENTKHIHYRDPYIQLVLPVPFDMLSLSEKDKQKNFSRAVDYIVFAGVRGFMGSSIVAALKEKNKNVMTSELRLEKTQDIGDLLDLYTPKYVINAAGLTGTPNVFWCDDHPMETMETNLTFQLTMAKMCHDRNIHLTVIGSGGIFENDKEYGEKDVGDFTDNFYAQCRIVLEKLVGNYPNVLYLRVNYPISRHSSSKNLLTKLIGYRNIESVTMSVTCVDTLTPLLVEMIENLEVGICNFVNPGSINLVDIMRLYQKKVPHHVFNAVDRIQDSFGKRRSTPRLRVERLLAYQPLYVEDAVRETIENYYRKE